MPKPTRKSRPARKSAPRKSTPRKSTPPPEGTVEYVRFESRVLRGNPLGDPYVRTVPVYLPPGYDDTANSRRAYPVVYILAGFTGRGTMLLNDSGWSEPIHRRLDRLIAAGKVQPMIVVLPDCFTRYGGSQYLDSSAHGDYESHLIGELVPWVDATYRTKAKAAHRGIAGKSSGGYGAMIQGLRHPEVFSAVADHSGDAAFEYCYMPDFPAVWAAAQKHGSLTAWWAAFQKAPKKSWDLLKVLNIIGMAAAYSPNPKKPLRIDLPFDLQTGAMDDEVWMQWLSCDPVRMVEYSPEYRAAAKKLKLVYVDCGIKDEFNLQLGARMLVAQLKAAGAKVIHEEFDDGHMDISYRYDRSLAELSKVL